MYTPMRTWLIAARSKRKKGIFSHHGEPKKQILSILPSHGYIILFIIPSLLGFYGHWRHGTMRCGCLYRHLYMFSHDPHSLSGYTRGPSVSSGLCCCLDCTEHICVYWNKLMLLPASCNRMGRAVNACRVHPNVYEHVWLFVVFYCVELLAEYYT